MKEAHLSTTNSQKQWIITANAVPFKATTEKFSRLFRGRTPFTSSTINILLYPLHTSALVCLLWLDRGHYETHCRLDAQLISCLKTTVIRSIFLQVTFEGILPNNILITYLAISHHISVPQFNVSNSQFSVKASLHLLLSMPKKPFWTVPGVLF